MMDDKPERRTPELRWTPTQPCTSQMTHYQHLPSNLEWLLARLGLS